MSVPLVVTILEKKYARLLGDHAYVERVVEDAVGLKAITEATKFSDESKREIEEKLTAIETVIWMYDVAWDPSAIKPIKPVKITYKKGELSKVAYAILRTARSPLRTYEIAQMIAERIGKEARDEIVAPIANNIHTVLMNRLGSYVRIVSENPIRWALISVDE